MSLFFFFLCVFLSEVKCFKNKMDNIRLFLVFDSGFYVDRISLFGHLGLFWNNNSFAFVLSYSSGQIDVSIILANSTSFPFIGLYM